ncbi:MAG TPA: hypothetical protein VIF62_11860 [Labilithrix sp.]
MGRVPTCLVLAFAVTAIVAACKTSTDCTCTIDQAGDHRVIACGETSCVGGTPFTCSDGNAVQQSGSCTSTPPPGGSSGAEVDAGGNTPPPMDHSCDDLAAFCSTSCRKPASVNADCLNTAGTGDPTQCMEWQQSNGALCSP